MNNKCRGYSLKKKRIYYKKASIFFKKEVVTCKQFTVVCPWCHTHLIGSYDENVFKAQCSYCSKPISLDWDSAKEQKE
jgi:hypothetical protein